MSWWETLQHSHHESLINCSCLSCKYLLYQKRKRKDKEKQCMCLKAMKLIITKSNGSGSYFDSIDIELIMVGLHFNYCLWFWFIFSLNRIFSKPRTSPSKSMGRKWTYLILWPGHKFLENLTGFQNLYDHVKQFYINGRPRQVASPTNHLISWNVHDEGSIYFERQTHSHHWNANTVNLIWFKGSTNPH